MAKVLVTGATGCIGSNLVRMLAEKGDKINTLNLPGSWHPFLEGIDAKHSFGDIRDREAVMSAMSGCEQVYQVAGVVSYHRRDRDDVYSTHVDGVRNVLDVARDFGVERVVVTASTAGIGITRDPNVPLTEESEFDFSFYGLVPYMHSKNMTIEMVRFMNKQRTDVVCVSPTTAYGAGDTSMHIGKLVKRIKQGRARFIPRGGNSFVDVEDIARGHILAMEKGKGGENYILASGCMTYRELYNGIAKALGVRLKTSDALSWFFSKDIVLGLAKSGLGFLEGFFARRDKRLTLPSFALEFSSKFRYFDSSKARNVLGWAPKVGFEDSIRRAIRFYEGQGLI